MNAYVLIMSPAGDVMSLEKEFFANFEEALNYRNSHRRIFAL